MGSERLKGPYLVHDEYFATLQDGTSHAKQLFFASTRVSPSATTALLNCLPSREIFTTLRYAEVQISENVCINGFICPFWHSFGVRRDEVDSPKCFILMDVRLENRPVGQSELTISASSYSSKTSRVERKVPLNMLGSSDADFSTKNA